MKLHMTVATGIVLLLAASAALAEPQGRVLQQRLKPTKVYVTADEIANPHLYYPRYDYHLFEPPPTYAPPPDNPVTRPGEFEEMDSVVIAVTGGGLKFFQMWGEMVAAYSTAGHTWIVTDVTSQGNVEPYIYAAGVDESDYSFLRYPINTIWIRDYGPEFGVEDDGTRHVIDADYSSRPLDDVIPQWIAASDWIESDGEPLENHILDHGLSGGNIMSDGAGTCFFSDIVYGYEKPDGWTNDDVDTAMQDYLGCEQIVALKPICNDGTGHIDLYAKLLGPTSMLLGEYPPDTYFADTNNAGGGGFCGDTTPNDYQDQEDNLATIEATTNLASEPWVVTRLHMLEPFYLDSYGWVYRSYMNSQLYNGVVAMPSYYDETGPETAEELLDFEAQAIVAYEAAMPGADVFPIDSDHIIPLAGAMHCITHEIPIEAGGAWEPPSEYCGNGIIENDEDCDTWNTNYTDCIDLGFEGGDVTCNMSCEFDTSDCIGGGDTDTDTDTDTDSDTDTGADAGTPADGGGDDDCGCQSVGSAKTPSLLQLLLD
jgi:agmatine/peptidylarginine deiminase